MGQWGIKHHLNCKNCDVKCHYGDNISTCETFVFCPKCKIHEIIKRHDDLMKFYTIKLEDGSLHDV